MVLTSDFLSILDALERELVTAGDTHSRAAHYHLGLLSVFFERQLQDKTTDAHADTSAARLVAAYTDLIERDYRKGHGIADYATALGVTSTHLTRCCNKTCGRSALAILKDRIHYEACILLRDTTLPINQIASELGFASPAYFSRTFQAQGGHSPSVFRQNGAAPQRLR